MTIKKGVTSSRVNLRKGPGKEHEVVKILDVETEVEVETTENDWHKVKTKEGDGFVHVGFIKFKDYDLNKGFLIDLPDVNTWPLDAKRDLKRAPTNSKEREIETLWKRYGGTIEKAAEILKIDSAVAIALMLVESGGKCFENGNMIIRFENHHFWKHWGKKHPDEYNSCFQFNVDKPWTKHVFREDSSKEWRKFHGNQRAEWDVYNKAAGFDEEAAQLSISMGLPQIMGSNHVSIGYDSVSEMFDAFSESEHGECKQIIGMFDFLQGPGSSSRMVTALQHKNFLAFATLYNGAGQAPVYANGIESYYDVAENLLS